MSKNSIRGFIYAALGASGWGLSGVCGQYLFTEYNMDSGWLTATRMVLSGIVLLMIALPKERLEIFNIFKDKRDIIMLAAFAVLGLLLCQYAFLAGIKCSNSATTTVLQSLNVVMMACIMSIYYRTRFESNQVIALILAVSGTFLIATHGNIHQMALSPAGLFLGILSAAGVCSYSLLSRGIIRKWGNITVTGFGMLIGGLVIAISGGYFYIPENLDMTGFIVLAVVVLLGTAGGFSLFLNGVRYIGPEKATLVGCLEPATATVLSAIWLHSRFGAAEIIGFICIVTTIFLSVKIKERPA